MAIDYFSKYLDCMTALSTIAGYCGSELKHPPSGTTREDAVKFALRIANEALDATRPQICNKCNRVSDEPPIPSSLTGPLCRECDAELVEHIGGQD